jgi:hypothetical protein
VASDVADLAAGERRFALRAGPCPQPFRVWVGNSSRRVAARCKSRRCTSCGVLWAGDVRRKILANVEAYDGAVALTTVTAPGVEVGLQWDTRRCAHLGAHRHSGRRGCRVLEAAAKRWNQLARKEWTQLHRKASQRAAREAARIGSKGWGILARQWEFQARGVLHMHVLLPMATPRERRCSQVYVEALTEFAPRHCFGYVDRGHRRLRTGTDSGRELAVVEAGKAARYLAKYIATLDLGSGKITLSETVRHADVPGQITYVSRRLTIKTGVTMRSLRRARCDYARSRMGLPPLPTLSAKRGSEARGQQPPGTGRAEHLRRAPPSTECYAPEAQTVESNYLAEARRLHEEGVW